MLFTYLLCVSGKKTGQLLTYFRAYLEISLKAFYEWVERPMALSNKTNQKAVFTTNTY